MTEIAARLIETSLLAVLLGTYLIGVLVALVVVDAPVMPRVGLALLWPVGPLAFVVTISILLAAVPIAFPLVGAAALIGVVLVGIFFVRAC